MVKKLKVLFVPFHLGGHVYSMIGLATYLQTCGHQILFFAHKTSESLYRDNDLETSSYQTIHINEDKYFEAWAFLGQRSLLDYIRVYILRLKFFIKLLQIILTKDEILKKLIEKFDPDVIIMDDLMRYPSIMCSGKPWVNFWSCNPLYLFHEKRPFGLVLEYKSKVGASLARILIYISLNLFTKLIFYLRGYGLTHSWTPKSPFLNFYLFPKELDYGFSKKALDKTFRLDTSLNMENKPNFVLDENIQDLIERKGNNKIILISFGLLVSKNVEFMRKMVRILSKSNHYFIFSKGVNHELYKMSRNMCGARFVNQKQLLPLVDLVISHGGNNSFTEAFYFGKPQIIIPFWSDQHDNAKRIHDLKLGQRIDYSELSEKSLLGAIDALFKAERVNNELAAISARIQRENQLEHAKTLIEELANNANTSKT